MWPSFLSPAPVGGRYLEMDRSRSTAICLGTRGSRREETTPIAHELRGTAHPRGPRFQTAAPFGIVLDPKHLGFEPDLAPVDSEQYDEVEIEVNPLILPSACAGGSERP